MFRTQVIMGNMGIDLYDISTLDDMVGFVESICTNKSNAGKYIALQKHPHKSGVLVDAFYSFYTGICTSLISFVSPSISHIKNNKIYLLKVENATVRTGFRVQLEGTVVDIVDHSSEYTALMGVIYSANQYCTIGNPDTFVDICRTYCCVDTKYMNPYFECMSYYLYGKYTEEISWKKSYFDYKDIMIRAMDLYMACIKSKSATDTSGFEKFLRILKTYKYQRRVNNADNKPQYRWYSLDDEIASDRRRIANLPKNMDYPATPFDDLFEKVFDNEWMIYDYLLLYNHYRRFFDDHKYVFNRVNSLNYFRMMIKRYNRATVQIAFRTMKSDNAFEMIENYLLYNNNQRKGTDREIVQLCRTCDGGTDDDAR